MSVMLLSTICLWFQLGNYLPGELGLPECVLGARKPYNRLNTFYETLHDFILRYPPSWSFLCNFTCPNLFHSPSPYLYTD